MIMSIIPGYYIVHSRLRTTWEKMSWLVLYPGISGCIAYYSSGLQYSVFLPIYGFALSSLVVKLRDWIS